MKSKKFPTNLHETALVVDKTSLCSASSVGSQRDAARFCCLAPARLQHGARSAPAAIDRYLLPAGRSAANPPAAVSAVDRWDRRTDIYTDGRLTVAYTSILCWQRQKEEVRLGRVWLMDADRRERGWRKCCGHNAHCCLLQRLHAGGSRTESRRRSGL